MFYAWKTSSDFGNGLPPVAKSRSQDALVKKMFAEHKSFFVGYMIDSAWADLITFGPGGNTEGREVSEDRTKRYLRGRKRKLEENGIQEITSATPLREEPSASESESALSPNYQQAQPQAEQRQKVALAISPVQVKAIYQFLALDEEQRGAAIDALSALSMSADAFKSAVGVMLEPNLDLVVSISEPDEEQQ